MDKHRVENALEAILELLAAIEHERWSHWQRYMHQNAEIQADGSMVVPADLVRRWEHQFLTGYSSLSEREKESDREQVRRYLPAIADCVSKLEDL